MPTLAKDTRVKLLKILARNASDAATIARQLVPVDTGHLRSTIAVSQSAGGVVRLVVGAYYAHFVEFGTIFMAAQPFFNPALAAVRSSLKKDLKRLLKDNAPGLSI